MIERIKRPDMATLYITAATPFFPSHFEGLVLPVLEAQTCGTLVVCSDLGALSEVQSLPSKASHGSNLSFYTSRTPQHLKYDEYKLSNPPRYFYPKFWRGKVSRIHKAAASQFVI